LTGGQNVVHEPLQFEVVLVSGPNQYSVKPLAFVSTAVPPTMAVLRVFPLEAGATAECVEVDGAALPPDPELPHPATISAAAAKPAGTSHL
jgi:hypothetical protein